MTGKKIRLIVTTVIALMTLTIMCTAVSSAASKKAYKLPVKVTTQDGVVKKITYKGNTVKFSCPGPMMQKFTYKGKNKYKYKSNMYNEFKESATVRTKSGHIVSFKGKNSEGRFVAKYSYKKGRPNKCTIKTVYKSGDEYKGAKCVTKIKADKRGNIKKAVVKRTLTKRNGKRVREEFKDVYRNKYKGKYLQKSSVRFYGKSGKSWTVDYADSRTIKYKRIKLTKKQYKKYKPIIEYLLRDDSTLY